MDGWSGLSGVFYRGAKIYYQLIITYIMRSSSPESCDDSDSSAERGKQFKIIYTKQLKKKQALELKRKEKEIG
jgi:hypothetical protein